MVSSELPSRAGSGEQGTEMPSAVAASLVGNMHAWQSVLVLDRAPQVWSLGSRAREPVRLEGLGSWPQVSGAGVGLPHVLQVLRLIGELSGSFGSGESGCWEASPRPLSLRTDRGSQRPRRAVVA